MPINQRQPFSFPHLIRHDNQHRCSLIATNSMMQAYHSPPMISLEYSLANCDKNEYLKRYYQGYEWEGKVRMLSEYYQYHKELPRLFHEELRNPVEYYQEDVRNLEYQVVSRKMKGQNGQGQMSGRGRGQVEKVIQGVELSYFDFEKKDQSCNKRFRSKKSTPLLPSGSTCRLKTRDINRPVRKESQAKDKAQEGQQNFKVLSRSKSKPALSGLPTSQAGSRRPSCQNRQNVNPSLHKGKAFKPSLGQGKAAGMGGMFNRAVHAKKMIKLGR